MEVEVNYLAVLLAGVSSMVVGAIWYSRSVFGEVWMKLAKVKMNGKMIAMDNVRLFGLTFLASLVMAYVLAHVTFLSNDFFGGSFLSSALTTAFWLWLGFTAVRFLTHDLFEGRPMKLTLLSAGNELVTVLVMALVIGAMGA
ncbi:MAG TPA: DUF1761 domain-containing protein [Candidatus Saccharimonadales bacterium]